MRALSFPSSMGEREHLSDMRTSVGLSSASVTSLCLVFAESYFEDYATFVVCPEGTVKMRENAVTKGSRAKAFVKFMMAGSDTRSAWTWEFLMNTKHLKM